MSLVSIIIPYFKKKKYINSTLQSVIKQKYKKFEILIVYDDKDTSDISFLKKIIKKDKRIKLIINKKNIGAGLSRNKAIKKSKGKFIAFIDADDLWHRSKLTEQIKFMKNQNIDISHTSYQIINSKNNLIGTREAKNLSYCDLLKSCDIGLSTVVIKKKLLSKYLFANLSTKEDYVLWLRLSKKNKIYALKKKLVYWRKLSDSLSSSTIRKILDGYIVYRHYLKQSVFKSLLSLLTLSFNYLKK